MASLMDIAAVPRTIEINGIEVAVYGVSALGVARLMVRFPVFGKFMSGVNPSTDELMKIGPDALAAFIASGTGKSDDRAVEEIAANLSVGSQLELVELILKLTFPRGVGPFVQKLRDLGVMAQQGVREVSTIASQEELKSSSPTTTQTPGPIPHEQSSPG